MRKLSKICAFLAACLLLVSMSITAYAASSVTYYENANKFIFAPGTKHSPTNLFPSFQNVMPGDVLTEQILIKNDVSNKVKIKLYMRSHGAQENTDLFLSQLDLTVQQRGDSILFQAPADQTAQLKDWVYLGTIYSGGSITLDVTLKVPITLSNEFQHAHSIGYLDWEFKIEELPVEPSDPTPPKTGDSSNIHLYAAVMIISFTAIVILMVRSKRKKDA